MLKPQPLPQLEAQLQAVLIEQFPGNYGIVMGRPMGLTNISVS
jgi:hypothetical protein